MNMTLHPLALAVRSALLFSLAGAAHAAAPEAALDDAPVSVVEIRGDTDDSTSYGARAASTATRFNLSLRETPQSVTVITRQRMDDMNLTSIADVLVQTPGITVQENDTERTGFSSRGFSISNFQVDGVAANYSSGNSALFDTALYDRIEVVRGATGLVTGAGDPSATINMVHKRPTRQLSGSSSVNVGSWDMRRVQADISAPLNEAGTVRASLIGVVQNRHSHLDLYKERKIVAGVLVEADLGRDSLLTVGADYQHNTPKGTTWGTTPLFFSDGTPAKLPRSFNVAAEWSSWERTYRNVYANLEHRINDDWKVKVSYNRLDSTSDGALFYGGSGYPNRDGSGLTAWIGAFPYEETQDNLDLYATGGFTLFGRKHELVAGWNGWRREGVSPAVATEDPLPFSLAIPDLRNWTGKVPQPTSWRTGASSAAVTEQSGAYLAARLRLADPLQVIGGARLSTWKTRTDNFNTSGGFVNATGRYASKDVLTPYAGVVFDLAPNTSLYASYSDLFKPQNYKDKDNNFLDPVTGSNVEAGVKAEFFGGRLNAAVAVFEAKQDNLGEEDSSVPQGVFLADGTRPYISTGKGTKSRGIEAEVSGSPLTGWQLAAGVTRSTSRNAKNVLVNTIQPRDMVRLTSTWRLPGEWRDVTIGGGVNWQSEIYVMATSPAGKVRTSQAAYTLLNLMGRYQITRQLSAGVNINNLLDKTYYRKVGFYNGGYYGEPRSVSANLRYQY
ncbi:TonB-dependent siderophore receptor [Massilia sp. CCM 8734]|nr:TonB-dependent siderophore receptor [Massilia sp. CCM 8734]